VTAAPDIDDLRAVRALLEKMALPDEQDAGRSARRLSPSEADPDYRAPRWVETWQLCKELNISDDFAYTHKRELGASVLALRERTGRPVLRWDMETARAFIHGRRFGGPASAADEARPPSHRPRQSSRRQNLRSAPEATSRVTLTPRPYEVP
jgi:hypothetical protein